MNLYHIGLALVATYLVYFLDVLYPSRFGLEVCTYEITVNKLSASLNWNQMAFNGPFCGVTLYNLSSLNERIFPMISELCVSFLKKLMA